MNLTEVKVDITGCFMYLIAALVLAGVFGGDQLERALVGLFVMLFADSWPSYTVTGNDKGLRLIFKMLVPFVYAVVIWGFVLLVTAL